MNVKVEYTFVVWSCLFFCLPSFPLAEDFSEMVIQGTSQPYHRGGHVTQAGQSMYTLGSSDWFRGGHTTTQEPVMIPDCVRFAHGHWEENAILSNCKVHVKLQLLDPTEENLVENKEDSVPEWWRKIKEWWHSLSPLIWLYLHIYCLDWFPNGVSWYIFFNLFWVGFLSFAAELVPDKYTL